MNIDCKHYERFCEIQAPCCKIFYPCRQCHDSQFRVQVRGCQVKTMDQYNVGVIRCSRCQTEQGPSNKCTKCGISFAYYYCHICNLWEDNRTTKIHHCDQCKRCLAGDGKDSFHCDKCNNCVHLPKSNKHPCYKIEMNQDCSVCNRALIYPQKQIQHLELCNHHMHKLCFDSFIEYNDRCPVCDTALKSMTQEYINRLDKEVQFMRQFIPYELYERKVDIWCMECRNKSIQVNLDFFMKCQHCGTYNTKQSQYLLYIKRSTLMNIDCKHYKRFCDKQAPCCKIFYPCRLCHDEQYKGVKAGGCKVETMDRYNVSVIRCRECKIEQAPSNLCTNCGIQFAHYYCSICKLWDDDKKKDIYHCDLCKMCRRGTIQTNFHCEICDVCMSVTLKDNHKCIEKVFEQNCAVCMGYLKTSTKFVQQLDLCGHHIHVDCFKSLIKHSDRCPVCNTALYNMSQEEIAAIDAEVEKTMEFLPQELRDKKVDIQCMECHKKSTKVNYHIYLKCQHCGSYNTKE